jgi:hypothetical protein
MSEIVEVVSLKNATLYFHYPCFDGLVSGVLAWAFLADEKGWRIERFSPIDYSVRETWLSTKLDTPCAIVDFLYHPLASLWADHHLTSFVTLEAKHHFESRGDAPYIWFDRRAESCAAIIWRHLSRVSSDRVRYEEMVHWANKIDSANYRSAEEAIFGEEPALRINSSLFLNDNDKDGYSLFLLKKLRSYDLSRVAELPEVKSRFEEVRRRVLNGLNRVKSAIRLEEGGVATFDINANDSELISRYAPYYFNPDARYSIGVLRTNHGARITAMRNPWMKFQSIPLGSIFERFGGGGHQRVAAVLLPNGQSRRIKSIVSNVLSEIRNQTVMQV